MFGKKLKYKILKYDTKETNDRRKLYRIMALKSFDNVKKGDIGGYIEHSHNLSQEDDCWIYNDAKVYGGAVVLNNAKIYGNAIVNEYASVSDNATVFNRALITGHSWVKGNSRIYDNAVINDNATIKNLAMVKDNAIIRDHATIKDSAVVGNNALVADYVVITGNSVISRDARLSNSADFININLGGYGTFTFYKASGNNIMLAASGKIYTVREFKKYIDARYTDVKLLKRYYEMFKLVETYFGITL